MKTVALIGGIGSGKSTVSMLFAQHGAGVISLDAIGHHVLELPEVKYDLGRTFGMGIFDAKGNVMRPRLAAAAFDTSEHTAWLNGITHPAIMKECDRRIVELGKLHSVVLVEVTAGDITRASLPWADAIVAVSAPEEVRLARACARGDQDESDVRARMDMQPTDAEREAIADYVVENAGSIGELEERVEAVWQALT